MFKSHSFFRHCALTLSLLLPMSALAATGMHTHDFSTRAWNSNNADFTARAQKKFILGWYTLTDTQLLRLGSEYTRVLGRDGFRRFSNLVDFAYKADRLVLGYQFMNTGMSMRRHSFWGVGGGLHGSVGTQDKFVVNSYEKNTPFNISGYLQLGIGGVLNLSPYSDDITVPYVGFKGILGFGTADGLNVYAKSGIGFNGILQAGVYFQSENVMGVLGFTNSADIRLRYGFNMFGTDSRQAPPTDMNAHEYTDTRLFNSQIVSEGRSKGFSMMVSDMVSYQFSDLSWVYLNVGLGYVGDVAYNVGVGVRIGLFN